MRPLSRRLFLSLLVLSLGACVFNRHAVNNQPATYIRVVNQNFLDMDVFVVRSGGGQRIRLGTATGNGTSRFVIPSSLIFGPTPLRFVADPIGGRAASISSEVTVSPGDQVEMQIPPG